MFFLFIVPHIISNHFDKDFCDPELDKSDLLNFVELYARDYDSATITVPGEMALMLIKWDDAIVEFNFIESIDKKRYTFTKDIGLSLFLFKETKVQINISFKTDLSFYICPLSEINTKFPIIHFNNMKRESFQVDKTNITNGISIVSIVPFMLTSNRDNVYLYVDGRPHSSLPITYTKGILCLRCSSCNSDATIHSVSYEDAYPTIPTVVELKINEILDNKKLRYNLALGNNNTMDYIERLNNYKYVFLKNEITDTKKYKLFVTDVNNERVELRKGEVFRRSISDYSNIGLSIASKNCQENNIFDMFSGNQLEINDAGEIVIESFTDNDIPSHCRVKDSLSPGIIAAIVIVVIVVVVAIIVVVIIFIRKKKLHRSSQEDNTDKSIEHTSLINK